MKRKTLLAVGIAILCTLLLGGVEWQTLAAALVQEDQPTEEIAPPRLIDPIYMDQHHSVEGINQPETRSPIVPSINVPWSAITFASYRDGNYEIYRANGSGGNQTRLTSDPNADTVPRFNPGCTKIAFDSYRTGISQIFSMNPDGSGLTQLTSDNTGNVFPAWSPDGNKIAFQSYRDGQAEIYVMNADGTNQARLTWDKHYDGQPTWSPDGSKIAFISQRTGVYRVYVMKSNGSGLTQLSTQPYSFHPVWSPRSGRILYDADGDGDGWQELWMMNADGSNQHLIRKPPVENIDDWAGTWTPNEQYVVFMQIRWVEYHKQWYWTSAYIWAWDMTSTPYNLTGGTKDWYPDWQTTDASVPTSSMAALPVLSPGPIIVSWSGSDSGISGLANFDVQVREGVSGNWTDWMMATTAVGASYPGVGGHAYYFRVRARDYAGNMEAWPVNYDAMTTVEALAPQTKVYKLPAYVRNGSLVKWGGSDPGDSGIQAYYVQYRDDTGGGNWIDWIVGAANETSAYFYGEANHIYSFRSRATDNAYNDEGWPTESDASTTLYSWAITGKMYDNAGAAVADANILTDPGATLVLPGDINGNYGAYVMDSSSAYTTTWAKDEYGNLPTTSFPGDRDAQVDLVFPPTDNIVRDWGFESGNITTSWVASGIYTPSLQEDILHTGDRSGFLGNLPSGFAPPLHLSEFGMFPTNPKIAADGFGNVHAVWSDTVNGKSKVIYAKRSQDGVWSPPEILTSGGDGVEGIVIAVDGIGTVYSVWIENGIDYYSIFYSYLPPGGDWISPMRISDRYSSYYIYSSTPPQLTVTTNGIVHIVWSALASGASENGIYYVRCVESLCSTLRDVSGTIGGIVPHFSLDPTTGAVHIAWEATVLTNYSYEIFYAWRDLSGNWSNPQRMTFTATHTTGSVRPQLSVDGSGTVHLIWIDQGLQKVLYTQKTSGGDWSSHIPIFGSGGDYIMKADHLGNVHILFDSSLAGDYRNIFYLHRSVDGTWTPPEQVSFHTEFSVSPNPSLVVDGNELHLVWVAGYGFMNIYYAHRDASGVWCLPVLLADGLNGGGLILGFTIDSFHQKHVIWSSLGAYYIGPALAPNIGNSAISQSITIPPTMTAPTLSYLYQLHGASVSAGSRFSVSIQDGITTTTLISTSINTRDWEHAWYDLTPWLGQTITLTFNLYESEGYAYAWAYLDEVSVGSAHPDVWVSMVGNKPSAIPDERVVYQLTYGNRGGADSISNTITTTLPAGLVFESATIAPTITGNKLVWEVGDLEAHSSQFTIIMTVTVASSAPIGSTLSITLDITTTSPEIETVNNTFEVSIFVGRMVFLPTICKQ